MGIELEADISLGVALGGKLDNIHNALNKRDPLPTFLPRSGSNTAQGGGNVVIDIGRPPIGRLWNILSVCIVGSDDHTTVAGAVGIYVDADPANLSLSTVRLANLAVPSSTFITRGTLWAHSEGAVCANITGTSGNPQILVNMSVAEWRVEDISNVWTK